MLERVSGYMAAELELDEDRREIIQYGLTIFANFLVSFLFIALAGYLTGALWTTLCVMLVSAGMKIFAGGAHAATFGRCLSISLVMTVAAGWLAARLGPDLPAAVVPYLWLAAGGAALYAVWRWAPMDPPNKPLFSDEHRRQMRRASFFSLGILLTMIAVLGAAGWVSGVAPLPRALFAAGVLGLLLHTFVLSPAGYRLTVALGGAACGTLNASGRKEVA